MSSTADARTGLPPLQRTGGCRERAALDVYAPLIDAPGHGWPALSRARSGITDLCAECPVIQTMSEV
jgi:hypothetical protein